MENPLIVITGGGRGIGAAIALAFAQKGNCRLALTARSTDQLSATAKACQALGVEARAYTCDVSDADAVTALAEAVRNTQGEPDGIVNNAGFFLAKPFLDLNTEEFDTVIAANLRSAFLVSRAFAPGMAERKRGTIINIASSASRKIFPGMAAYSAAKYGLLGMTRVMRQELTPHGVRVICILPGPTHTNAWDMSGLDEATKHERLMPAADVAQAVVNAWELPAKTVVDEIWLQPLGGDL
ncbi:SDR family oxidoreductase [Ruficoccus amylovorans]|uniref:SDR family oxidoreductase n=1 Tax=Ruficoccus amylovorans TaxID=1804625 RepID=A0A842HJ51_9BACT|nr:SDR family oxidoreductase [Ruficoccus amylovorans]MBC2596409.1 SDR family oxidoreductase [Ruficoccus amylovorans]